MRKYKVFILVITCFLVNSDIFSLENNESKNSLDSKKFSIGLGVGLKVCNPFCFPFNFDYEFIDLIYRPNLHFQISIKSTLLPESIMVGYSQNWNNWRWFAEGGIKVDYFNMYYRPVFGLYYIGPEFSTGLDYLILKWFAIGLKINANYMFDMSEHGQGYNFDGPSFRFDHPELSIMITSNFVF